MKLIKYVLLLLMIAFASTNSKAQTDKIKQIDALMNEAHKLGTFNGNVLVAEKGTIIYQAAIGFADGAKSKNLTPALRFDIGSISKEFNGVGIMLLKEQGKLQLDDKITKYLPDLPKWAEKIQIKNLIQYTSGLPVGKATSDEEYRSELAKLEKLEFEPGKAFIYSNSNVYLQKRIIERISGFSYKEFAEKNILTPCKMTSALIDVPTGDPSMAKSFDNNFVESKYAQQSSGWVRLTINDLYLWTKCLNSYQIIKESSFRELAAGFGDSETSLGSTKFENNKLTIHQHHGSNYNYEAIMFSNLTDDLTIILMTNNQNFKVHALRDAIVAILNGKPFQVPKKSIYLDIREKVLANFEDGLAFYNQLKETQADRYDLAGEFFDLVNTGKYLQRRERYDDAIRLFHIAALFEVKKDDLSYCFELIADSYSKKGSRQMALIYYKKALEKDETNKNARGRLDEILNKR